MSIHKTPAKFKVAAVQINVSQPPSKIVRDIERYLRLAKRRGVAIACFPECVLNAGPRRNAAYIDRIRGFCKDTGVWCIVGANLKDAGKVYNTAVLIDGSGRIAGSHRKVHLCDPPGVRPGSGFKVFDTPFGKIGISICWDTSFPRSVESMAKRGAKVVFCPMMWYYERWAHEKNHRAEETKVLKSLALARAFENLLYVVFSNVYDPRCKRMLGYSAIAGPHSMLADIAGKEGMIVADVDLGRLERIRGLYAKEYDKKIF
jgi:predicted amidohydrolase